MKSDLSPKDPFVEKTETKQFHYLGTRFYPKIQQRHHLEFCPNTCKEMQI